MRKVRKLVREALGESEFLEDESQLIDILERKVSKSLCWVFPFRMGVMRIVANINDDFLCLMQINSSSKFTVDGKYVRLVTKC